MTDRLLYTDWREENASRAYPFADTATLRNPARQIPVSAIIDARVYTPGLSETHLSRVTNSGTALRFVFRDDRRIVAIGEASDPFDNPLLPLADPDGRPAGVLLFSDSGLSVLSAWGLGDHDFTKEATVLAIGATVPIPEVGVQAFRLPDGTLLTGDVWFVAGSGVIFEDAGGQPVLHAVGSPYAVQQACQDAGRPAPPFRCFRTINDRPPSRAGNINVVAGAGTSDSILRITNSADGLHIHLAGTD